MGKVNLATRLLLLLAALACGIHLTSPDPSAEESVDKDGTRLTLFQREDARATVFVLHSVFQDHQTSLPMARAMWNAGFRVLTVEFPAGKNFADYSFRVRELVEEYKSRGPVYAVGHSMGADIAFSSGGFDRLAALGFPVDTTLVEVPIVVCAGAWDQVHTLKVLEGAAGSSPLVISPFSDHSQESLDPCLQNAVAAAFDGVPNARWPNKVLAQGCLFLCLSIFTAWVLPAGPTRKTAIGAGSTAVLFAVLGQATDQVLFPTVALAVWAGAAWANSGTTSRKAVREMGLNLVLAASVMGLSWMVHSYQNLLAQPSCLVGLPVAVLSWFPILACRLVNSMGSPMVVGLLSALEVAFPGRLLSAVRGGVARFYRRILGFQMRLEFGANGWQALALAALVVAGGVAWSRVWSAGYALDSAESLRLLWKLVSLIGLPIFLWFLMIRKLGR